MFLDDLNGILNGRIVGVVISPEGFNKGNHIIRNFFLSLSIWCFRYMVCPKNRPKVKLVIFAKSVFIVQYALKVAHFYFSPIFSCYDIF